MEGQSLNLYQDYRLWLESELVSRCDKNPRYSLRAFAKTLKLSPAFISRVLSGKRPLTLQAAEQISQTLAFSPADKEKFISLIIQDRRQDRRHGRVEKTAPKQKNNEDIFTDLSMDAFSAISDWYHYALTELTFLKSFKSDSRWIAKMLGISVMEAKSAIERLKRLGILMMNKKGNLIKSEKSLTTTHDISSAALRKFHKQVLQKAIDALETFDVSERDVTSITMAIDVKKIPQAKEKIKKFRRNLCQFLEDGKPSHIYNLGIQLFPLSKGDQS